MNSTENLFTKKRDFYASNGDLMLNSSLDNIKPKDIENIYKKISTNVKLETKDRLKVDINDLDNYADFISSTYSDIFNGSSQKKALSMIAKTTNFFPLLLKYYGRNGDISNLTKEQQKYLNSLDKEQAFIHALNSVSGLGDTSGKKITELAKEVRKKSSSGAHAKAFGSFLEAVAIYGVGALINSNKKDIGKQIKVSFGAVEHGGSDTVEDFRGEKVFNKGDLISTIRIGDSSELINISMSVKGTLSKGNNRTFSAAGGMQLDRFKSNTSFYDSFLLILVWHRHLINKVNLINQKITRKNLATAKKLGKNIKDLSKKEKQSSVTYTSQNTPLYSSFAASLLAEYAFLGEDRPLVLFTFFPDDNDKGVFQAKFLYKYFEEVANKHKFPLIYNRLTFDEKNNSIEELTNIYHEAKRMSLHVDIMGKYITD